MKLLYHHRTQGGGVEGVHILGIARAFERRGWSVQIVSPPGVTVGEPASQRAPGRAVSPLRRIWSWISDRLPQIAFECLEVGYNLWALRRLAPLVRRSQCDLVYERYALFGWATTWLARRRAVPIVLEINDATMIVRTRPLRAQRIAAAIERWTFRNATHLVTVSQRFREMIVATHRIAPERISVLPNAVDAERFPALNAPVSETRFTLGMVAAFVPWHGIGFLLDALHDFLRRTGARLLLVGDGPERPVIEERIARYQLGDHVELTGFVPATAVPSYLAGMDLCVIANSNEHGSLMKLFEYMVSGKALLAPDLGPVREIITHDVDGWLFHPLDCDSLRAGVETLYAHPERRHRLGQNARACVLQHHTWDHRVRDLLHDLTVRAVLGPRVPLEQQGPEPLPVDHRS